MNEQKQNPFSRNQTRLMLYALGVYMLLKSLYDVIKGYLAGGPDAPSQLVLIVSLILMGGGSLLCLFFMYRLWKQDQAAKAAMAEAAAAMEQAASYEDQVNAAMEYQEAVEEYPDEPEEFSGSDTDEDEEEAGTAPSFSESVE